MKHDNISVAVVAERSLRSPRKLFIVIIKKYVCRIKVSKNKIDLILKKTSLDHIPGCRARVASIVVGGWVCYIAGGLPNMYRRTGNY